MDTLATFHSGSIHPALLNRPQSFPSSSDLSTLADDYDVTFDYNIPNATGMSGVDYDPILLTQNWLGGSADFTMSALDNFYDVAAGSLHQNFDQQLLLSAGFYSSTDYPSAAMPASAPFDPSLHSFFPVPNVGNVLSEDGRPYYETPPKSRPPSCARSPKSHLMQVVDLVTSPLVQSPLPLARSDSCQASPELDAEHGVLDGWSCFRCDPSSETPSYPRTARIHLEGLEHTLKSHDSWKTWNPWTKDAIDGKIRVGAFDENARDTLMVITQSFLHKAREIHGSGSMDISKSHGRAAPVAGESGYVVLPPTSVLELFLREYVRRLEPYYNTIAAGQLSPTSLMDVSNKKPSSLLLLLMIAQGAVATPTVGARHLASGLTEACRISLSDSIDKDIMLSKDPTVLQSALVFVNLAAWSGDKWHMDVSVAMSPCTLRLMTTTDCNPTAWHVHGCE